MPTEVEGGARVGQYSRMQNLFPVNTGSSDRYQVVEICPVNQRCRMRIAQIMRGLPTVEATGRVGGSLIASGQPGLVPDCQFHQHGRLEGTLHVQMKLRSGQGTAQFRQPGETKAIRQHQSCATK